MGLLFGAWVLVVGWQVEEHIRVVDAARANLRRSSLEVANTLSAVTRAFEFHGTLLGGRMNQVLDELAKEHTNALVKSSGVLAVGLLNANGDEVEMAGNTNLIAGDLPTTSERWSDGYVTFVLPVEVLNTNPPVLLSSPPDDFTNGPRGPREFRRGPRPEDSTNGPVASANNAGPLPPPDNGNHPPDGGDHPHRRGRPPWLWQLSDAEFKVYAAKHELHGLVLAMSTATYRAVCTDDFWLRCVVCFFATISALGAGLAWRNMGRTADLQIRLVRASELNSHLKELNLAAAGLAHETRNPLNIIRGQAQLISRLPDTPPEVREKSLTIVNETDKVTSQLTEFINYSRPREVRRSRVALTAAGNEIIHTLGHDIEEKQLHVEVNGDSLVVEADEQLLRQVLFNLLINAIQAADREGKIQIQARRASPTEAVLEVRDDGPGVQPENRQEIFKPYFTTHQKGTGLGLAVVQQIVLAHGWDITCLANEPRGAIFRITHLKIAP